MKPIILVAAVSLSALVPVHGQGYFEFNTHDLSIGNDVRFLMSDGSPASAPDLFVEVLAGDSTGRLVGLTPLFRLDRTGAVAGYTDPLEQVYPGPAHEITVAYRAFEGTTWATSSVRSDLEFAIAPVVPGVPPGEATPVLLGIRTVELIPEPSTLAFFLLGLCGIVFAFSRHPQEPRASHWEKAEPNHCSECGRAAALAVVNAVGRPRR
jgi:hypothetical protein